MTYPKEGRVNAVWSATFDHVDGQALVTNRVVKRNADSFAAVWTYSPGGGFSAVTAALRGFSIWLAVFRFRVEQVYLVCSRSVFGFIRDIPALLLARFGVRVVVHCHGSDFVDLFNLPVIGALARYLYRNCEVIVPSAHLINALTQLPVRQVHLVENFIECDNDPVLLTKPSDCLRVYWNSNVISSKGVVDVAEGVALARAEGLSIKFTIIGRPIADEEASERRMAEFLEDLAQNEENKVLGSVSKETAADLLREADVVILPSRYSSECQPLAIVAAMGAGRQVIVSDTPALSATVGDYPALRIRPGAENVKKALIAAARIDDCDLLELHEAAYRARIRFSADLFDRKIRDLLFRPMANR